MVLYKVWSGIAHKSRKSMHNKSGACPNKGGEEQFVGRAPYNKELEATFKMRIQIPLEMTPAETVNPAETPISQEPTPAEAMQVEHDPAVGTGQVEEYPAEVTGQVEENPAEVTGQLEDDAALQPQVIYHKHLVAAWIHHQYCWMQELKWV